MTRARSDRDPCAQHGPGVYGRPEPKVVLCHGHSTLAASAEFGWETAPEAAASTPRVLCVLSDISRRGSAENSPRKREPRFFGREYVAAGLGGPTATFA